MPKNADENKLNPIYVFNDLSYDLYAIWYLFIKEIGT